MLGFAQQTVLKREVDKHGIINFMVFDNKTTAIPLGQSKILLHDSLKLRVEDELVLQNETKDALGFTRQFYEQHYKGIKVDHGLYGVHSRNGKIEYISGEYKNVKIVDIVPTLSENQALHKVLNYINAAKYKWENPSEEKFIKTFKNDSTATNYPKGDILICIDALKTDSIYRLAYRFDIFAEIPFSHKLYYIDAATGEILNFSDLICDANITGTAATRYSGTQTITTDSYPSGFRLRETRNGVRVETYNLQRTAIYANTDFPDNDNNWTAAEYNNTNYDNAALDAHWGLERVYEYWHTVMQRNSLNNAVPPNIGLPLINYVHANLVGMGFQNNDNAFWDNGLLAMTYGDGQYSMNPVVSLDVIAHETGHGIMHFTDAFSSGQENMSLNEGFSDIWAAVIEHWAAPNDPNKQTWLIGEQILKDGTYLRSLSNPKSKGQPDTYNGTYWINPSGCSIPSNQNDNCYSHTDMSILSHWFYLLSQGASGTNDFNHTYTVLGIGIDNAAKIVYQAENVNLTTHQTADYNMVMTQTIQAATDLYTANSLEVMQVKNAWYAVGLGTKPSQITITGPATVCSTGATFTLNSVPSNCSINWTFSSTLIYVSGQGTNQLVVKASDGGGPSLLSLTTTENYGSSGLIRATITDAYGNVIIEKTPWVGLPDYTPIVNGSSTMFCSQSLYVEKYNRNATWSAYGPLQVIGANYGYKCTVKGTESGVGWVYATNSNLCGSFRGELLVQVTCSSYSVFPNPTNSEVTISLLPDNSIDKSFQKEKSIKSIRVVDKSGITLSTQKYGSETIETKIDLSKFTMGVYIIKINEGPDEESYTIVKQ